MTGFGALVRNGLMNLLGGGRGHGDLWTGSDPTELRFSTEISDIDNVLHLPATTTSGDVHQMWENATAAKGQLELLRELSQASLQYGNAQAAALNVRVSHLAGASNIVRNVARSKTQLDGVKVRHSHLMGSQQAKVDGYRSAYDSAFGLFQ